MQTFQRLIPIALFFALSIAPAQAAKFANQYVEFELPPLWECSLENGNWVCMSTSETLEKDAVAILTAKKKGPSDSLSVYLSELQSPRTLKLAGKSFKSKVMYAKKVSLAGQTWVDSMHGDSQIPGYYTRYMATTKEDLGVLVTLSVLKSKYKSYLADIESMVKSLRVFHKPNQIPEKYLKKQKLLDIPSGMSANTVFGGAGNQMGAVQAQQQGQMPMQPKKDYTLFIIIAAALGVGFVIWKKRHG